MVRVRKSVAETMYSCLLVAGMIVVVVVQQLCELLGLVFTSIGEGIALVTRGNAGPEEICA